MPTPEMNVLFFYPVNGQPTFSVYSFPSDGADPQQLLVLAVALIQCSFEVPKLVPVFLHEGQTHFGDELWSADKHGELVILPLVVSDEDSADAITSKRSKPSTGKKAK